MNDDKIKSIIKTVAIILAIGVGIYLLFNYEGSSSSDYVSTTKTEEKQFEIEELQEENSRYKDKISELNSEIEELEDKLQDANDLIEILQDQLESYGIEPNEL